MKVSITKRTFWLVFGMLLLGIYYRLAVFVNERWKMSRNIIHDYSKTFNPKRTSVALSTARKYQQWQEDKHDVIMPVVTMFTTIRDRESRKAIHSRLIRNWAALAPDVDPVLFVPYTEYNTSWIRTATSNNWTVRILYALRHNLPIIRTMFKETLAISRTPFIGYANADILFDKSLTSTLCSLSQTLNVTDQMILITGRRRNVKIDRVDLGSGDNLTKISQMDSVRRFHGLAQDYFIISRRGLPWEEIPDFVVGRNGYDNWLVAKALDWDITLIDASKTVLALHQTGIDGYRSGSRTVPAGTKNWNKVLGKGIRYRKGSTAFAPFYTKGNCTFRLRRRDPERCNQIRNITLEQRCFKRRCRKESEQTET